MVKKKNKKYDIADVIVYIFMFGFFIAIGIVSAMALLPEGLNPYLIGSFVGVMMGAIIIVIFAQYRFKAIH